MTKKKSRGMFEHFIILKTMQDKYREVRSSKAETIEIEVDEKDFALLDKLMGYRLDIGRMDFDEYMEWNKEPKWNGIKLKITKETVGEEKDYSRA